MRCRVVIIAVMAVSGCGAGTHLGLRPGVTMAPLPPLSARPTTTATTTTVAPVTYVVQVGDTLSKIAAHFKVSAAALAAVNGITDPNSVTAGQTLIVPSPGTAAPTTTSPTATT